MGNIFSCISFTTYGDDVATHLKWDENLDKCTHGWQFGIVGNDVGQITEVAVRRIQLGLVGLLEWVTVSEFKSIYLRLTNHPA